MEPVRNMSTNPQEGFAFTFDWSANSKTVSKATTLQFKPPCLTSCALHSTFWALMHACISQAGVWLAESGSWSHCSQTCTAIGAPAGQEFHVVFISSLRAVPAALCCGLASAGLARSMLRCTSPCRFSTGKEGGNGVVLWIYAVPTSATTTRTIINSVLIKDKQDKGPPVQKVSKISLVKALSNLGITTALKLVPRWALILPAPQSSSGQVTAMLYPQMLLQHSWYSCTEPVATCSG